jgi:hypothetical protein
MILCITETILSMLAGLANCFGLTILAAVYCGIINPEFKPGLSTKSRKITRS